MKRPLRIAVGLGNMIALIYGMLPLAFAGAHRGKHDGASLLFVLLGGLLTLPFIYLAQVLWSMFARRWVSDEVINDLRTVYPFTWRAYMYEALVGATILVIAIAPVACLGARGSDYPWALGLIGFPLSFVLAGMRYFGKFSDLRRSRALPYSPVPLISETSAKFYELFLRVMLRLAPNTLLLGCFALLPIALFDRRGTIGPSGTRLVHYAVVAGFLLVACVARWLCRKGLIALARPRAPEVLLAKRDFALEAFLGESVVGISFFWTLSIAIALLLPKSDYRTAFLFSTAVLAIPAALLGAVRSYHGPWSRAAGE